MILYLFHSSFLINQFTVQRSNIPFNPSNISRAAVTFPPINENASLATDTEQQAAFIHLFHSIQFIIFLYLLLIEHISHGNSEIPSEVTFVVFTFFVFPKSVIFAKLS